MEMEHLGKMLFSFPLPFSFSGTRELLDFSEILPTFHYICILLQMYLYLSFFFGQQNRLWCWISALFIVGFQMSHRYISAAAVADPVMPLGSDSERDVALAHCGYSLSGLRNTGAIRCRWWESINESLMQSISRRHNAPNTHFTSFGTFSELIWKNTTEDEEILLAEVCNCSLSKKIHFILHGKKTFPSSW